jgi:hypothetical protein
LEDSTNNSLKLNIDDGSDTIRRFKSLLGNLAGVLDVIKSIYETSDNAREMNVTKYYDEETLPLIQRLYKNF